MPVALSFAPICEIHTEDPVIPPGSSGALHFTSLFRHFFGLQLSAWFLRTPFKRKNTAPSGGAVCVCLSCFVFGYFARFTFFAYILLSLIRRVMATLNWTSFIISWFMRWFFFVRYTRIGQVPWLNSGKDSFSLSFVSFPRRIKRPAFASTHSLRIGTYVFIKTRHILFLESFSGWRAPRLLRLTLLIIACIVSARYYTWILLYFVRL